MKNFNKNLNQTEADPNLEEEKKSPKKFIFLGVIFILLTFTIIAGFLMVRFKFTQTIQIVNRKSSIINLTATPSPTTHKLPAIPSSKILSNGDYHIFQSFNNCGPAALSMALRFYGINVSQEILGQELRPYQVPGGDNDDKSVTLEEVANKSKEYGFTPYLRPMGNDEIIKQFIAQDIPVITRTWTKPNEDIGHYRIIKGYDDNRGIFIQDDSLQGKDLEYTYADFNEIWKKFNYEYLVLVPIDKQKLAEKILGKNSDEKISWQNAVENSLKELETNPNDIYSHFNLSVAFYNVGEFQKSVDEFEKVENLLPFRTLWYQIEPIQAYYELGNYDRVLSITEKVLSYHNRAFSELYILRGKIYQKQGNIETARSEFQKAVMYNKNLLESQELLNSL